MGLAVLPARLKDEMGILKTALKAGDESALKENEKISKHYEWVGQLREKYGDFTAKSEDEITNILKNEIGLVYCDILAQAGVYKRNDEGKKAFLKFVEYVNK